jgi:hypothetical protein
LKDGTIVPSFFVVTSYLSLSLFKYGIIFMVFIIWSLAIFFGIYMLQRNARRSAARRERSREKYERLLDQLRKSQHSRTPTAEEDSHT